MSEEQTSAATIVAMERGALDRWGAGDPSGFLEISAPEVTYFDPFLDRRIDGLEALTALYEGIRGKVNLKRYQLINPTVQVHGQTAVLTFNYVSSGGNDTATGEHRWNCTEVYTHIDGQWRIIHTHWSFTNPKKEG